MPNNNTLKYRVGQLEVKVDRLDGKMDQVMENHLPHIDSKVERLTWLAGLNLLAIIGAAILLKFL